MLEDLVERVIGVDTHKHTHTAVIVEARSRVKVDEIVVAATGAGYDELIEWADTHCAVTDRAWAIEGTGSYGAGLVSALDANAELVHEIDRPSRPARRNGAKNDELDAQRAAVELLSREHCPVPRAGEQREAMRILLATRESASRDRTRAINSLKAAVVSAPEALRDRLRGLNRQQLIARCGRLRHRSGEGPADKATIDALRRLAHRIIALEEEIDAHTVDLKALTIEHCPQLLDEQGVGPVVAAQIYQSWSHSRRCRNEAAFASLAGTAPIEASSGEIIRYRLNRGGDRKLNRALHTVVLTRTRCHPETIAYIERRLADDKSRREARRCLKRYIARHMYRLLENPPEPHPLTT